jgi:FAD/FMN-containing dehydrogenase
MQEQLQKIIKGDVETNKKVLDTYSHDASLFEVKPKAVVFPKDSADVQALVRFVASQKK